MHRHLDESSRAVLQGEQDDLTHTHEGGAESPSDGGSVGADDNAAGVPKAEADQRGGS